ncbi:30S ribosomal protein S17 [Candidatus Roizmanbacteria bacterium RIFCSPLOWO2_01_FULL_38_12]|uniref:Small ribosomal subunit protein uS17 n=1 Tax=Candidatus Roizmanbacteria bacterium RIFCSPLOWO2_01_FULL_38_12 TaxID=1802061 RepID=A0A1F7IXX5_9BACT|nr:MAG: 30S ribosomal protein S17 [Candidatus Roizmanbacteria bacterium RIFCSPHIGHO2_01_FULL_38_15]OGK35897.1 MAG: 30S ribosomal protein S17 [Candidatus Roizmanbacteria bacterium RIFCSPHIGHO2_12_FULL_38_13]OGK48238.1 MAG: 30S ribosomal protein S17 [Candidatus Roizmanbacteria bacterium RIFCSPLOWO2_01_FULL_38_12]
MNIIFTGTVVSTRMQKTVVVRVETKFRHPVYHKVITKHKKFMAHNDLPDIKEGDVVTITQTRPLSKQKHFIVVKKLNQSIK